MKYFCKLNPGLKKGCVTISSYSYIKFLNILKKLPTIFFKARPAENIASLIPDLAAKINKAVAGGGGGVALDLINLEFIGGRCVKF